jgi:hypothetical protein
LHDACLKFPPTYLICLCRERGRGRFRSPSRTAIKALLANLPLSRRSQLCALHDSQSQSTIRPEPLIIWLPRVDWRVCGLFSRSQVNLMIRLYLIRLMRENTAKQTKRQENAGEGLVRFADQIWKIHCYLTPLTPIWIRIRLASRPIIQRFAPHGISAYIDAN